MSGLELELWRWTSWAWWEGRNEAERKGELPWLFKPRV
jgi:hypothetical protein